MTQSMAIAGVGLVMIGTLTRAPYFAQTGAPTTRPAARVNACSLLPKEEIRRLTGIKSDVFDMMKPEEEPVGHRGSSCSYPGVHIQIDPFTPASLEETRKKIGAKWETLKGIGDVAYLRDNKAGAKLRFAELYVAVGPRVLTIQLDVEPPEASIDTVRPGLTALAKALAAKLR